MARIFGLAVGTTSIGFAVIDHFPEMETGRILRLGVRVFPEARNPDGSPLNQTRRQNRMMRRQLRRRRRRRRALSEALSAAGLLPAFTSREWSSVMALDPYELRSKGLDTSLEAFEFGRALYHLAKRRHFLGRDLEEEAGSQASDKEKEAKSDRESTLRALQTRNSTLGRWLAEKKCTATKQNPPLERRRGIHAHRAVVEAEFEKLWAAQLPYHPGLLTDSLKAELQSIIFFQRPVFWRKNTLGQCRFMPKEALCPRGSWLSSQKRMLEKLNNLGVAGGNVRPLDQEERAAILAKLQTQASMSWAGVRAALRPLYKARGEAGAEKSLKFNLEIEGDRKLPGNPLEAKLAAIFGDAWKEHRYKQAIRDALHQRLWGADYDETPDGKRVVILDAATRKTRRTAVAQGFRDEFRLTAEQCEALTQITLPTGWEPFAIRTLRAFLPHLEAGVRFGDLLHKPEWEDWRNKTFPNRCRRTGTVCELLPTPANREEQERLNRIRNPTAVRTQNELRKVVNNLVRLYGKPDLIRIELARDLGRSKRELQAGQGAIRKSERQRKVAVDDLKSKGINEPSRETIEKWLLWKEGLERCPYTGRHIDFDDLFRTGDYEVGYIWPRSRSLDSGFGNKMLCHKDVNLEKGHRTPYQAFQHDEDRWEAMKRHVWGLVKEGTMPAAKARRFCWEDDIPDDFASRQLNDTGYAARETVSFLSKLWPDGGAVAPVAVQAVSGRVTAQLRKLWHLDKVLSEDGERTRADHRHHAIDALTVACAHPEVTHQLSCYWHAKDEAGVENPNLPAPWPTIRTDATKAVKKIVVSHRVRKKVSGPLHKETTYGDTGVDVTTASGLYRQFVTRKRVEALSRSELGGDPDKGGEGIRDARVREVLQEWVRQYGGDPRKAFPSYPRIGEHGPEIRKVRLLRKQQLSLMAPVSTGYSDLGNNHHIAIYRCADDKVEFEVVSLYEASRRLARREPVVRRDRGDGSVFLMSLASGEAVEFPEGEKKGVWIVTGVWSGGQVVLEACTDAVHATTMRPRPSVLIKEKVRKVSVDPIGRVRPASD